jgi:eukaryotic-like serine/threonine-protein kinase
MTSSDGPTEETLDDDREELRELLGMTPRRPPAALTAGQVIGESYRIERTLGAGGMGVVYAARDVRLGRDVAIKVHAAVAGEPGGERLLREAAALARLVHPNVVTVYQVGTWAGHPYVVMELVPGGTARDWLKAAPRTVAEIVELHVAAARGLAAAHAAGLVHRDFKPDNVLVGDDGRVRVADFGLARGFDDEDAPGAAATPPAAGVTATGAVMGTPGYMAPEQRERRKVGPAADQYAFGVTLWEALCGTRPTSGQQPPPEIPRPIARVLTRALAADPQARHPTMAALIDELAPPRRAARWPLAAGGGVVLAGGAVALAWALVGGAPGSPCAAARRSLDGIWDPARRQVVGAAHGRAAARLDTYAARWTDERVDACEATHVRREQSPDRLDQRNRCLDRQRAELGALVALLSDPDVSVADPVGAALHLGDPAACRDPQVGVPLPDDPAARAEVEAVDAEVVRADSLYLAGQYGDGLAVARAAVRRAAPTRHAPVVARAQLGLGRLEMVAGDRATARQTLATAVRTAAEARDDALAAAIWIETVKLLVSDHDLAEAERLLPFAEAAIVRAGSPPRLDLNVLRLIGEMRQQQGRFTEARDAFEQAVARGEQLAGPDEPLLASSLTGLGAALERLGDFAGSRAAYDRGIALVEAAYGPDSAHLGPLLNNLAILLLRQEDFEASIAVLERGLAIKEREHGPDHPALASSLMNLANSLWGLDRPSEALPHFDRAVALLERAYGPDRHEVAAALLTRSGLRGDAGDRAGAVADAERAARIIAVDPGPDPTLAEDIAAQLELLRDDAAP